MWKLVRNLGRTLGGAGAVANARRACGELEARRRVCESIERDLPRRIEARTPRTDAA